MNEDIKAIGIKCPKCDKDQWFIKDESVMYKKICTNCYYIETINKQDFANKFECPDCGSLSGKLKENDIKLGVRCNNCGKLHIVLEKHTTVNNRNKEPIKQNTNQKKCPKCGGTEFTPVRKKFSLLTGFATNKTELICNKCGSKVK